MPAINSRELLINEIADAMNCYSNEQDMVWCIDLTAQEVTFTCDPSIVGKDCMPEVGHLMIDIDRVPSRESFLIMENFTSECTSTNEQRLLNFALRQRHPFSAFKDAVWELGIQENWFRYEYSTLRKKAEEWMTDNNVDFIDGKIVCQSDRIYAYQNEEEE